MYYLINKSPWSCLDENEAFLTTADSAIKLLPEATKPITGWKGVQYRAAFPMLKPSGANFYPPDMDKMDAMSFFTVIRRHSQVNWDSSLYNHIFDGTHLSSGSTCDLYSIAYSQEYHSFLTIASDLLHKAGDLVGSPSLKRLLHSKADAFLSNDYYDSDIAWMELDSMLDVTIGPYETYEDSLFGYKFILGFGLTVRSVLITGLRWPVEVVRPLEALLGSRQLASCYLAKYKQVLISKDLLISDPSLGDSCSPNSKLIATVINWSPPPKGFIKLNVDAATTTDWKRSGIGGVLRDDNGTIIDSYKESAGVAVDWVRDFVSCPVVYAYIVKDIIEKLRLCEGVIRWVNRTANLEADALAKAGIVLLCTLALIHAYVYVLLTKATFEAFIGVRDEKATAQLKLFGDNLQVLEQNLPMDDAYKSKDIIAAPIRVVQLLFNSGDVKGPQTIAFNLPNDERIVKDRGTAMVILKNVSEAKFKEILRPIADACVAKEQHELVDFESFFTHTICHECCHGIGPHTIILPDGRKSTVRLELQDLHSALEEAKADIVGLWALKFLIRGLDLNRPIKDMESTSNLNLKLSKRNLEEKIACIFHIHLLPNNLEKSMYVSFLAGCFRSVRFGLEEAHGKGQALQFNWLLEKEAFVFHPDETFSVNFDKIDEAVESLSTAILTIQAKGDKEGASLLLQKYCIMTQPLKVALRKLESINVPVDIAPTFPVAKSLLE
ncbi:Nudix hydrolase 3 [Hibiscus syriacus]|uniref:Nudix hydrolase 3 n=1 Tax=Hibiscus syriacus TaxID=106335 RepID=A0A6A2X859_HIBSY|nr:Nudix hydrolase 3 [Hibiscus syriacus]